MSTKLTTKIKYVSDMLIKCSRALLKSKDLENAQCVILIGSPDANCIVLASDLPTELAIMLISRWQKSFSDSLKIRSVENEEEFYFLPSEIEVLSKTPVCLIELMKHHELNYLKFESMSLNTAAEASSTRRNFISDRIKKLLSKTQ